MAEMNEIKQALSGLTNEEKLNCVKIGKYLEVLVFDSSDDVVTSALNHPNFSISEMAIEPEYLPELHWQVRKELAESGYFLEHLILDQVQFVASTVLRHPKFKIEHMVISEEQLAKSHWFVKKALADAGRFLDLLANDDNPDVVNAVRAYAG